MLFRLFALLLPLLLCACEARTAGQPSEIESPLQNNCQPADGHSKDDANMSGWRACRGWRYLSTQTLVVLAEPLS